MGQNENPAVLGICLAAELVARKVAVMALPRFARGSGKSVISRARMSQSSIAGRKASMIDCRRYGLSHA
jgi:hypothetical protein